MSINDLFYTDKATLKKTITSKPNEYGIVQQTYEVIAENVPASITPISHYHSQQKYGINTAISLEVSMDYIDNCESTNIIEVENTAYQVESFTIYPSFMCLPKSITYGLKR